MRTAQGRAQVDQLPGPMKDVLRAHPALMSHMLEIARLWEQHPQEAQDLAALTVREQLSLSQVRDEVRARVGRPSRDTRHNQSVDGPLVTDGTIKAQASEIRRVLAEWSQQLRASPALRPAIEAAVGRLVVDLERLAAELEEQREA